MPDHSLKTQPWRLRYVHGERLLSAARKLKIQALHQHCNIEFQGPVHIGPDCRLLMYEHRTLIVGPYVDFDLSSLRGLGNGADRN